MSNTGTLPSYGFSAVEIVQCDASSRPPPPKRTPHRHALPCLHFGTAGLYVPLNPRIPWTRLTEGFYNRPESLLDALRWWDMPLSGLDRPWRVPGEHHVIPATVETRHLLIFGGMGERGEREELNTAKAFRNRGGPGFTDQEIHQHRIEQRNALIQSEIFRNWEEIDSYLKIQAIIDYPLS